MLCQSQGSHTLKLMHIFFHCYAFYSANWSVKVDPLWVRVLRLAKTGLHNQFDQNGHHLRAYYIVTAQSIMVEV